MQENDSINNKRILSVDYGTKFTGLALYHHGHDPFVMPFDRIKYQSDQQICDELKILIQNECVDLLVLGMPYLTDGTESTMTKKVKDFSKLLQQIVDIPVYWQDEGLTSYEAQQRMKNDPRYNMQVDYSKIDALAAAIILEDFLRDR